MNLSPVREKSRGMWGRFTTRLVVGMLVTSLPIITVLTIALTRNADASLREEASTGSETIARSVSLRLEDWISERNENLAVIAKFSRDDMTSADATSLLQTADHAGDDYTMVELVDASGRVVNASRTAGTFETATESWFSSVMQGHTIVTSLSNVGGEIRWVAATPIEDAAGRTIGAVVANLNAAQLPSIFDAELRRGEKLIVVDRGSRLIFSNTMGTIESGRELLAKGTLHTKLDGHGFEVAQTKRAGAATFRDLGGHEVIGGYDTVDRLGWVVSVAKPSSVVLAPIADQEKLGTVVSILGTIFVVAFALWFARRTTRPVLQLADAAERVTRGDLDARAEVGGASELQRLGQSFNAMVESLARLVRDTGAASTEVNASAAQLSASSEELAATTTQQSAAVSEASATTEELARASASIAETVNEVATQANETRENLEQAEADMQASSERTLALADRVNEIGAILTLINDIADQTNLLALNAAIEAARAGEGGRGFAVVAEEVRRLAERSKHSAAEIAEITQGVHTETNATVMAMEKGSRQMQRGLALLEDVAHATEQVRLTTQQQQSATTQVVETMDQLSDASRQVSATAQQLASASASLVDLAGNLEQTAALATAS